MASGWEVYYVVFLSAGLAISIPFVLTLLSGLFFSGKRKKEEKTIKNPIKRQESKQENKNDTLFRKRLNIRFYLGLNASMILISLALMMVPFVGAFHPWFSNELRLGASFALISVSVFSFVGLLYSIKKGDLSWIETFQRKE